jgi:hypothetical protein
MNERVRPLAVLPDEDGDTQLIIPELIEILPGIFAPGAMVVRTIEMCQQ